MANIRKETVTVTTDASGDAVAYTQQNFSGLIVGVLYDKVDFADGVDFLIETAQTGQTIWDEDNVNSSKDVHPVVAGNGTDGAASTLTEIPIPIADEPVKITIANGGNVKLGRFTILVA